MFIDFRGGEKRERKSMWERNINQLLPIGTLTRDQMHNLCMCPEQGLNLWPLVYRMTLQLSHPARALSFFLYYFLKPNLGIRSLVHISAIWLDQSQTWNLGLLDFRMGIPSFQSRACVCLVCDLVIRIVCGSKRKKTKQNYRNCRDFNSPESFFLLCLHYKSIKIHNGKETWDLRRLSFKILFLNLEAGRVKLLKFLHSNESYWSFWCSIWAWHSQWKYEAFITPKVC